MATEFTHIRGYALKDLADENRKSILSALKAEQKLIASQIKELEKKKKK